MSGQEVYLLQCFHSLAPDKPDFHVSEYQGSALLAPNLATLTSTSPSICFFLFISGEVTVILRMKKPILLHFATIINSTHSCAIIANHFPCITEHYSKIGSDMTVMTEGRGSGGRVSVSPPLHQTKDMSKCQLDCHSWVISANCPFLELNYPMKVCKTGKRNQPISNAKGREWKCVTAEKRCEPADGKKRALCSKERILNGATRETGTKHSP